MRKRNYSQGIRNIALISAIVALNLSFVSAIKAETQEVGTLSETKTVAPLVIREAPEVVIEKYRREVTEAEYKLLERVCMSEAGNQPLAGKIAVLETVLNRVDLGYGTIEEVVYAANQFSTANNGEPNAECTQAVEVVLKDGNMYDDKMIYFRGGHYHSFGTPYMQIGDHYFSLGE